MNIIVFTDGACTCNGKTQATRGGYGIYFPNKEMQDISREFTHKPITNQRAELYAIYKTLKITKNLSYKSLTIYTDSEYSINCITKWLSGWKKKNWKRR